MSAVNETRYVCDCCGNIEILPQDTGGPAHGRMSGPINWTMLRVGTDPATPPQHLCEDCSKRFILFMANT